MEEVVPRLATRSDYVDIAAMFTAATGIKARQFCELAFGAAVRFITNVETQLNDPSTAFLLTPTYFQQTAVAEDDIRTFFARLSTTPADLQAQSRQNGPGADFRAFQRNPLIEYTAGTYLCIDPGFLLDKAGSSLYWTLHEATNRRQDLLTSWCGLIEFYVHWLFAETYQGRGQWLPAPQFATGGEACDLCLVEGSELVLFEVKASVLTAQAKYGFSADTLISELYKKAIKGDDGERKGVAQLLHNAHRFLSGDDILGVNRTQVQTIYPVLVFLDHGFTAPYLNLLYNEHYGSALLRRQYRRRVTPLFSLTIDDLENTLPHTHQHAFTDILESYYRANRNMYGELSHSSVPILLGETPGRDPVRQRFEQFGVELEHRFFPRGMPTEP